MTNSIFENYSWWCGGTSYQGNSGENGKDNVVGGAGGYTSPSNGNGGITDNGGGGGTVRRWWSNIKRCLK